MTRDQQLLLAFERHWAKQHPAPDLHFAVEQAFLAGAAAQRDLDGPTPRQSPQDGPRIADGHPQHELGGEHL